jgi:5'-nucleotidase
MLPFSPAFAKGNGRKEKGKTKPFRLTILHNNDAESQLIDAGSGLEDFGGAARFKTKVNRLRFEAWLRQSSAIMLSSGDNFLAGPEFNASLEKGIPFYDSIFVDFVWYQALCLGNHDFDFNPDVLAQFIEGVRGPAEFLSANLDFSFEPPLLDQQERGKIAKSIVIKKQWKKKTEEIGVVGATTENLPFISSPRFVIVNEVAPAVQAEIDELERRGVNKIILISHLQSIEEDLALIPELSGVDVAIAGGGDEVLANEGDLLVPGDEAIIYGAYPQWTTGADGAEVPVVTTAGNLTYVGRLVVEFDKQGKLIDVDTALSGPQRVAGGDNRDAVPPNPFVQCLVVEPIVAALEGLANNVIGTSEVALNGERGDVRTIETNEGNLIADALRWQATQLAADFGMPVPDVALQNGGGIRNDDFRGPGDITELDTFDMVPFSNFVTIVPGIPRDQFKEILENAVSRVEFTDGRFAQVSGFSFVWNLAGTPQELDGDGFVVTPGSRIVDVMLDDGTPIVVRGAVQAGDPVTIATIDFLARGGDQYPYRGATFLSVGVTYQQALSNYIADGLLGVISAAQYPEGGEGRIMEEVVTP